MIVEQDSMSNPRVQQAIEELTDTISAAFPGTTYVAHPGIDKPLQTWLVVTVDLEDPDEVLDLVIDRLTEMRWDEGMPIHVIPINTPERDAEIRARQRRT